MSPRSSQQTSGLALLALPSGLILAFLILPLAIVTLNSLVQSEPGQVGGWPLTLANFNDALFTADNGSILLRTVAFAATATVLAAALSLPIAMVIVGTQSRAVRAIYTIAALSPLLVSVVLRTFGWQVLLGTGGPIDEVLTRFFGPEWLLGLIGTRTAAIIGMTHMIVPFILLGLLPSLDAIDPNVVRAARTLGASRAYVFWHVIVPLARGGLTAGSVIAFAVASTAYVTPALLGGPRNRVYSSLVFDSNFVAFDWNLGAALAIVLLLTVVLLGTVIGRLGAPPVPESRTPRHQDGRANPAPTDEASERGSLAGKP